jgi:hypothetical protein
MHMIGVCMEQIAMPLKMGSSFCRGRRGTEGPRSQKKSTWTYIAGRMSTQCDREAGSGML